MYIVIVGDGKVGHSLATQLVLKTTSHHRWQTSRC